MATIPGNKPYTLLESKSSNKPRAHRRASGLGGELWGDTGAPALATLDLWRSDNEKVVSHLKFNLEDTRANIL
jgi:very-long-chain ceramide synthase